MSPPTTCSPSNWAVDRVTSLPEFWALVAEHGNSLVSAFRMMRVCTSARVGIKQWLATLPSFVVCGGYGIEDMRAREVWRLDLVTLQWAAMSSLMTPRWHHACCAVRDTIVVLGGKTSGPSLTSSVLTSSVEMYSREEGAWVQLPPLACGGIAGCVALAVEESDSAAGQVLLLGGNRDPQLGGSEVQLVDLATGACTRQPDMLHPRTIFSAARLKDGRVVCAGGSRLGFGASSSAEVYGPAAQGALEASWTWTELPAMIDSRSGCLGCVLSDGRFAVLGGYNNSMANTTSSCEALVHGGDGTHWVQLADMREPRRKCACASVAGNIIVAGGYGLKSAEVYDEVLDRWFRLPHDLPVDDAVLAYSGGALMY